MLGSLCDGWRRRRAHGVIDNVLWHGKRPRPPKADESPTPGLADALATPYTRVTPTSIPPPTGESPREDDITRLYRILRLSSVALAKEDRTQCTIKSVMSRGRGWDAGGGPGRVGLTWGGFLFLKKTHDQKNKSYYDAETCEIPRNAVNTVFHKNGVGEDSYNEKKEAEFTHCLL